MPEVPQNNLPDPFPPAKERSTGAELGAVVLSLEGRRENVNTAKLAYRNLPGLTVMEFDIRKLPMAEPPMISIS